MYIDVSIGTCMYAYIATYRAYAHMHACKNPCSLHRLYIQYACSIYIIAVNMCTCARVHMCTYTYTCARVHVYVYVCTCTCAHVCARMHACYRPRFVACCAWVCIYVHACMCVALGVCMVRGIYCAISSCNILSSLAPHISQ